jgi:hypothetical protein
VLDAPMSRARGLRAPGTGVPGLVAYGTYRGCGWKDFLAMRRGQRAIRLSLTGHEFASIVLGVKDPEGLARRVRYFLAPLDPPR